MTLLRRLSYLTLGLAITQLVFGAIVRITGSGMGCGEHWPKCFGHWLPPVAQPHVIIEWTHRLIALLLFVSIAVLAIATWLKRNRPGVSGRGGVLRMVVAALALWFAPAVFGAITVWLGIPPWATVVHWLLAATLLAVLAAAVIRSGGLGGASVRTQQTSRRAARGSAAAAGIALLVIMLGGMTANIPGASFACQSFPLCGGAFFPAVPAQGVAQHVQMVHRIIAYLLFLHVLGLVIGFTRRREAPVVLRAVRVAFGLIVLQIVIAASMIELRLPPELRSLHQAVGVGIWLSLFALAYLAHLAARSPVPIETRGATGTGRAMAVPEPSSSVAPVAARGTES